MQEVFEAAARADAVSPINESGQLVLDGRRPGQVYAREHAAAVADLRDETIMLAVHPEHRRRGIGTALLGEVLAEHPGLSIWAFGTLPGAAELASKYGFTAQRTLLRMTRPLEGVESPPGGVAIDSFAPADADRIVEINAAAFAHHPEQGKLTRAEFDDLTNQPWFSAEGLKVARVDGELAGFHWTKRHGDGLGEVYVLAVHPDFEGRGLGRSLLAAGLTHLREAGDREVELYVEGSETRVVAMYEAAGFGIANRDTNFGRGE